MRRLNINLFCARSFFPLGFCFEFRIALHKFTGMWIPPRAQLSTHMCQKKTRRGWAGMTRFRKSQKKRSCRKSVGKNYNASKQRENKEPSKKRRNVTRRSGNCESLIQERVARELANSNPGCLPTPLLERGLYTRMDTHTRRRERQSTGKMNTVA